MKTLARGRPPAKEREFRHEAILDAATAVFLKEGYARASMEKIARSASASKQTIYAIYPSKADLFAALVKRRSERLVKPVAVALFRHGEPARKVLYRYATQVLHSVLSGEGKQLQKLLIAEASSFPDLAIAFWQNGPGLGRQLLRQYLASLVAQDVLVIDNLDFATEQFLGSILGGASLRIGLELPLMWHDDEGRALWVRSSVDAFLRAYDYKGGEQPRK